MYKCQATGKQVGRGEDACKLVTHIRPQTYYRFNHKTGLKELIGEGTEIVRELLVSKEYYNQAIADGFQPELVVDPNHKEGLVQRDRREQRRSYDEDESQDFNGEFRKALSRRDRSDDSRRNSDSDYE